MSATIPCVPSCCSTTQTVDVPGSAGAAGWTTTTANFVIPAVGATVVVAVGDSTALSASQNLFIGGANFQLTTINGAQSITIKTLGFTSDTAVGATVVSGAIVTSGTGNLVPPIPIAMGGTGQITAALAYAALYAGSVLPIANGGTAATTKAGAQLAIGVGQAATSAYVTGLAQDITAVSTLVAGASITPANSGLYLLVARVSVDFTGATFAANRTVTIKIRNVTAAADIGSAVAIKNTAIITTTSYPTFDWDIPVVLTTLAVTQQLQIFAAISVVPSAGTIRISEAFITAIPMALS